MTTFEMIKNSENHTSLIDILEFFALATKSVIEDWGPAWASKSLRIDKMIANVLNFMVVYVFFFLFQMLLSCASNQGCGR